ncbi:hypothetical protein [Sinomicrobium soli]|uniref:hypothetical protein n=1 Tax=Sinomicrobium sp. N-1-3-6 TaxID=2219864 RepID=UPI000DCD17D5|nr:hypothetical protein [Sinomicrobium sp. N-1-3-6]RAV30194.1 hypothetical protein DN748_05215 [Sinomicrobium sp. N-1-3-6]
MKKYAIHLLFCSACILFMHFSHAQNTMGKLDDTGRIAIAAYVSDQVDYLPPSAANQLQSRLAQVVTANGLGDSGGYFPRFIITPNISVLDKHVVTAAPPKVLLTLEVAIFVGDGISGKKFGQTAITVKGVGKTETKAYIAALRNIRADAPQVNALLANAKNRILEYYNTECDFILKEAEALAGQNRYDEALAQLMSVPETARDCYNQALDMTAPLYRQKIDYDCKVLLNQARNTWNAGQDYNAATEAAAYLNQIDPNAACYGEVRTFAGEVRRRVEQVDNREWNFILKQEDNRTQVDMQGLKSYREISLERARNQPQHMSYNIRDWW